MQRHLYSIFWNIGWTAELNKKNSIFDGQGPLSMNRSGFEKNIKFEKLKGSQWLYHFSNSDVNVHVTQHKHILHSESSKQPY